MLGNNESDNMDNEDNICYQELENEENFVRIIKFVPYKNGSVRGLLIPVTSLVIPVRGLPIPMRGLPIPVRGLLIPVSGLLT